MMAAQMERVIFMCTPEESIQSSVFSKQREKEAILTPKKMAVLPLLRADDPTLSGGAVSPPGHYAPSWNSN